MSGHERPTAALAEALAAAEAFGSGRLVPLRLHDIRIVLRAIAGRVRRRAEVAAALPVGLAGERQLLLAQRERAALARVLAALEAWRVAHLA